MKRFIVTAVLVSFFIGLLIVYLVTSRPRGYEDSESSWDGPKVIHDILTQDECNYIINKANDNFTRSSVIGVDGPSESRTSETAWISKNDPVARKVLSHACSLTGKPYENTEDLQVVRYKPGTYYNAHHDSCCEESESCSMFENTGGQRVGTLWFI
jgi:prolyl 4-hydroxylase